MHSIPAYKALEKSLNAQNDIQIDWLVYENLAPVLYEPIGKEKLITLKNRNFSTLITKATELKNQYDHVIDLQGLFKTALMSKIIAPNSNYGFNMPRETWARYFYKKSFCDYKSIESKKHVIEQNLELCNYIAQEISGKELSNEIEFLPSIEKSQSKQRRQVCLIPATTWESKHWHIENWTYLIENLEKDADIFMTGSPANIEYLKQISNSVTRDIKLVTDKKLEELYGFYSEMDLVIGVDTGPLHIAAASLYHNRKDKQIIGIYGPSSGSRSGPYGFTAMSADELFKLKASNKKTYEKDSNSINMISYDLVLKAIDKVKV